MSKLYKLYGEHPSLKDIERKHNLGQIYSATLVTLTSECENNCLPCFTELKRKNKQKMDVELYDDIMRITKKLGGEAIRIGGRGEPLLDSDLFLILEKALEYDLHVVLFSNLINLNEVTLRKIRRFENVSIMTKLWGNSKMMTKMTRNEFYQRPENIIKKETPFGEVEITPGIELVLNNFHEINCEFTNFGIEFMITEMNYMEMMPILSFMIENKISPYIRTPYPIPNSEGFTLNERGVGLLTKRQFDELNKLTSKVLSHYGIRESFRQGSATMHCMRTVYNFVFELYKNSDAESDIGKLIAQPCHHTKNPNIEITKNISISEFREKFFDIEAYAGLRKAILGKGEVEAKHIDLTELMEGCICANYHK